MNGESQRKKMERIPVQADELEIEQVEGGCLVYRGVDRETHRFLNHTAAAILLLCDGNRSCDDITAVLKVEFNLDELPERDVAITLEELEGAGLIRFDRGSSK